MIAWPFYAFVGFLWLCIIAGAVLYRRARPAKPVLRREPTIALIRRPGANIRLAVLGLPRKARAS